VAVYFPYIIHAYFLWKTAESGKLLRFSLPMMC
jgi:hypothetical protein